MRWKGALFCVCKLCLEHFCRGWERLMSLCVHWAEVALDHIRIKRIDAHIPTPKESFHNNKHVLDYYAWNFHEYITFSAL
jgi:hypothetical protein